MHVQSLVTPIKTIYPHQNIPEHWKIANPKPFFGHGGNTSHPLKTRNMENNKLEKHGQILISQT